MINYPVRVLSIPSYGTFVVNAEGKQILTCHNSDDANTIANALNAMNEFPKPLHEKPDEITFSARLFDWYDKYINPRPKK